MSSPLLKEKQRTSHYGVPEYDVASREETKRRKREREARDRRRAERLESRREQQKERVKRCEAIMNEICGFPKEEEEEEKEKEETDTKKKTFLDEMNDLDSALQELDLLDEEHQKEAYADALDEDHWQRHLEADESVRYSIEDQRMLLGDAALSRERQFREQQSSELHSADHDKLHRRKDFSAALWLDVSLRGNTSFSPVSPPQSPHSLLALNDTWDTVEDSRNSPDGGNNSSFPPGTLAPRPRSRLNQGRPNSTALGLRVNAAAATSLIENADGSLASDADDDAFFFGERKQDDDDKEEEQPSTNDNFDTVEELKPGPLDEAVKASVREAYRENLKATRFMASVEYRNARLALERAELILSRLPAEAFDACPDARINVMTTTLCNQALLLSTTHDNPAALAKLEQCVALEESIGKRSPTTLLNLAAVLFRLNHIRDALVTSRSALNAALNCKEMSIEFDEALNEWKLLGAADDEEERDGEEQEEEPLHQQEDDGGQPDETAPADPDVESKPPKQQQPNNDDRHSTTSSSSSKPTRQPRKERSDDPTVLKATSTIDDLILSALQSVLRCETEIAERRSKRNATRVMHSSNLERSQRNRMTVRQLVRSTDTTGSTQRSLHYSTSTTTQMQLLPELQPCRRFLARVAKAALGFAHPFTCKMQQEVNSLY